MDIIRPLWIQWIGFSTQRHCVPLSKLMCTSTFRYVFCLEVCVLPSGGRAGHLELLQDFWPEFDTWIQAAGSVSVREVVDQLDSAMAPILFPLKVSHTSRFSKDTTLRVIV